MSSSTPRNWHSDHDDELTSRLRALRWPEIRPELRDQMFEEFAEMLEQRAEEFPPRGAGRSRELLDFSARRRPTRALVSSRRLEVSRSWAGARQLRPAVLAG